ncbi:hypothetical protein GOP47_0015766 [Adiantum capillus-veneris]|uniref:Uncharacterized protein n=1 Tax=Adiantum capillus-veneris TaxID=13818 RepID=A0A9D4UKB7_ADICA|nr:hypothetical protein GOP47_0015766 [Adiantum capillus-veneris]
MDPREVAIAILGRHQTVNNFDIDDMVERLIWKPLPAAAAASMTVLDFFSLLSSRRTSSAASIDRRAEQQIYTL